MELVLRCSNNSKGTVIRAWPFQYKVKWHRPWGVFSESNIVARHSRSFIRWHDACHAAQSTSPMMEADELTKEIPIHHWMFFAFDSTWCCKIWGCSMGRTNLISSLHQAIWIRIELELEKYQFEMRIDSSCSQGSGFYGLGLQLETRRIGASPFQIKGIKNNLNIS